MAKTGAAMFNAPDYQRGTSADEILKNSRSINKKGTIKRLVRYMLEYRRLLVLALVMSVLSNVLMLIGPKLSGYAIDSIAGTGRVDFNSVFFYCALMAVFYSASSVLSYALSVLMIKISQKTVKKMRRDVFASLMSLPVSYYDTHQTGEILSRISYDIDTVNTSLSTDVVQILTSLITVAGSFIMMLTISPRLVLVFAFTIPLSFVLTGFITKRTHPLFRERSAALGRMNGFVEEMVAGHRTLKAYNREKYVIERFREKNEDAVCSYYNAEYYGAMTGPCVNFVNNLSLALITVFGALLYMKDAISIGGISSFVLYSRKFSGPINEAANIINEFQSALAAAERVFRIIDEPKEADASSCVALTGCSGRVEASHVSFSYIQGRPIFTDLNFTAEPGRMIAVAGTTGAGKTTMINLLMRFYDVDKGEICVDGADIRGITRSSLRRSYAMVLQDTWLFHGTVFDNIAYGRENATIEEVTAAAKAAKIHNYIMGLPNGYDTVISEDGINISKGEKQLLTIARAMLLDSRMLILDEATSNVDIRTEAYIQEAMRRLMTGRTCFVIAHRLSTIRSADEILLVKDGVIAERGTHDELVAKRGEYWQMYEAQME